MVEECCFWILVAEVLSDKNNQITTILNYNTSLANLGDIHNRYDEFRPQFSRIIELVYILISMPNRKEVYLDLGENVHVNHLNAYEMFVHTLRNTLS